LIEPLVALSLMSWWTGGLAFLGYRQAGLADDPRARSRVHARAGRRLARRHSRGYDVDGEAAERVRRLAPISTLIPQETEIFEARLRENRTVAAHRASMRDA
jgi:hypothetical protein